MINLDDYVIHVLMRDLVGHDRRPVSFLVYLWLAAEQQRRKASVQVSYQELAETIGISKSSVQAAVGWLIRRKLLAATKRKEDASAQYRKDEDIISDLTKEYGSPDLGPLLVRKQEGAQELQARLEAARAECDPCHGSEQQRSGEAVSARGGRCDRVAVRADLSRVGREVDADSAEVGARRDPLYICPAGRRS